MEKDPDKSPEENPEKGPEEKFLGRWSRRKAETAERTEADVADVAGKPQTGGPLSPHRAGDAGGQTGQKAQTTEILTDAHMPPVAGLTEDSDFSGFLSPGVSEGLRKQALRKLFSSPVFNVRDGLDDYDDDFRNFAALGDLITSDMKHQMELEEERKRAAREAEKAEETEAETPQVMEEEEPAPDGAEAATDAPPGGEINVGTPTDEDAQGGKTKEGLRPDGSDAFPFA